MKRLGPVLEPYLWWILFFTVLAIHLVWELLDDSVPMWDMAYHQLKGWEYLAAWQDDKLLEQFSSLSTYYPPLYYLQEATVLQFLPQTQFLALLANSLGLFLLSYFTYRSAALFMPTRTAAIAGSLPLLFPLTAWTTRLTLLDVSLAGWVAAAGFFILRSENLQRKGWVLIFGIAAAAGTLTKWTFILFLFVPVLYSLVNSPNRKKSVVNLFDAGILAIPFVFWWYLPNFPQLMERFKITVAAGYLEGDPGIGSLLGWLYYPRCLFSYYLQLPLAVFLVWGLVMARKSLRRSPINFLIWWLVGSLLILTLLKAKDPRYIMPLAAPLAVLLVMLWQERFRVVVAVLTVAFLQFVTVSFPTPLSPVKVALFDFENDTDYRSLRQEWIFYQTHYFDVAGPPRKDDWRHDDLLNVMGNGNVGFIPETAHLNSVSLQLLAVRRGKGIKVLRLGQNADSIQMLPSLRFVVGKTGQQGISYLTLYNKEIYDQLEQLKWPLIQTWELPDHTQVRVWRNPILSP